MTDTFVSMSRRLLFYGMHEAKTNPDFLRSRVMMLSHHARDEHEWEGGKCDFNELIVCSCGNCDKKGERHCKGKKYSTLHKLTCPYHSLAYEIECFCRAKQAEQVIHPELGRGHTNQLESANSTLNSVPKKELL